MAHKKKIVDKSIRQAIICIYLLVGMLVDIVVVDRRLHVAVDSMDSVAVVDCNSQYSEDCMNYIGCMVAVADIDLLKSDSCIVAVIPDSFHLVVRMNLHYYMVVENVNRVVDMAAAIELDQRMDIHLVPVVFLGRIVDHPLVRLLFQTVPITSSCRVDTHKLLLVMDAQPICHRLLIVFAQLTGNFVVDNLSAVGNFVP